MSAQFEWVGDFLAQGDEGNDRNRTECERRQKEMAARLDVSPLSALTDEHTAVIRRHKPALVALLADVATLSALLATAGAAGIAAGEPGWDWERRYTALDVLIATGHARFVLGRHYAREFDGGLDRNKAEQKALTTPPAQTPPQAPSTVCCGDCHHAVLPPNADPVACFLSCGLGMKHGGGFARERQRCAHFEAAP